MQAPTGTPVATRSDRLSEAIEQGRTAFDLLKKAIEKAALGRRLVDGVRNDAWNQLDRLSGKLTDRFPGQQKVVASFFMPTDVSSSRIAEALEEASATTTPIEAPESPTTPV